MEVFRRQGSGVGGKRNRDVNTESRINLRYVLANPQAALRKVRVG
jgi:hypothetical protein